MPRRPFALRAVRGLANVAARVYPASFRRTHLHDFGDVAEHLWQRERRSRPPWSAALETLRILFADTIMGPPQVWFAALEAGDSPVRALRFLASRLMRLLGGGGHDVALAVRAARRRPGFALLVVLTLALAER